MIVHMRDRNRVDRHRGQPEQKCTQQQALGVNFGQGRQSNPDQRDPDGADQDHPTSIHPVGEFAKRVLPDRATQNHQAHEQGNPVQVQPAILREQWRQRPERAVAQANRKGAKPADWRDPGQMNEPQFDGCEWCRGTRRGEGDRNRRQRHQNGGQRERCEAARRVQGQ